MDNRQLILAREYRELTQTELSKSVSGLSQPNLSRFEKGLDILSEAVQQRIIEFLKFPAEFYTRRVGNFIENAHYRKKAAISKSLINKFEISCRLIGYIIDELAETIEYPPFKLSQLDVDDGYEPTYIAQYNRRVLSLKPEEPVKNIVNLLESSGIIISEVNADEKFDGVSFFTDKGYPVIIINRNYSNDRKRFTLAHELGHILMHNNNTPISGYREKEKEANEFASEFLMPESAIKNTLRVIKLSDLASLKQYWLTSMASIIRRAKDLNSINESRYKYFLIEMSRNGYSRVEPVKVFIDQPETINEAFKILREDLGYSNDELSKYFALPQDVWTDVLGFNESKLRVLN